MRGGRVKGRLEFFQRFIRFGSRTLPLRAHVLQGGSSLGGHFAKDEMNQFRGSGLLNNMGGRGWWGQKLFCQCPNRQSAFGFPKANNFIGQIF